MHVHVCLPLALQYSHPVNVIMIRINHSRVNIKIETEKALGEHRPNNDNKKIKITDSCNPRLQDILGCFIEKKKSDPWV